MQTFLPYADFSMSAKVLDRQRLGKQRVEALQILKALRTGPIQNALVKSRGFKYNDGLYQRKTPWYNHPCTQMWKGYENGLVLYLSEMCREWVSRGYKDTCLEKARTLVDNGPIFLPEWIGDESFHRSHQSNLLRKNAEHYGQYFLGVPDDLPYVWPTP